MKIVTGSFVFLAWTCVVLSQAQAQAPGTFTPTGNMTSARVFHTATLLPDGKVLIAGGGQNFYPGLNLASAELYDPSTGAFTATGNMTTARARHTATLLPNGKVLIAGGTHNGNSPLASAELYDPSAGTFTATGEMTTQRQWHTATLLNNGKVLIAGGYLLGNGVLASAELYDPSTATFAPTGDMTTARFSHRAILLNNGKVFIVPGGDGIDDFAELYDPDTGRFSLTGWRDVEHTVLAGVSVAATVSLLMNGKVLLTLELPEGDYPSRSAQMYDPSAGTLTATGNMVYGRFQQTGTLLSDGSVLIAGSDLGSCKGSSSAELYDPASGTFSPTGEMITGRNNHTTTLLHNGKVLIAGGFGPEFCQAPLLASAELYNPPSLAPAPVLLSFSDNGQRQGAILHAGTSQIASPGSPAIVGDALEIYCTGLIDGSVVPPQVAIGGRMAEILFFGKAPGFAGLNQVNVRVPSGVAPGPAVPVRLTCVGRWSNEVTIGVQ